MNNIPQRVELLRQMIEEKVIERTALRSRLEQIQVDVKQIDSAISTFQHELEKLSGEKAIVTQRLLRGSEIGDAAIGALERLGGKAHYQEIKHEIEKFNTISGITEKSKSDSVWGYLNKSDAVNKLGRGEFSLRKEVSSDEKKSICRKYGLNPDLKSPWDMDIVWQAHKNLETQELSDFLDEMTTVGGKDWVKYYQEVVKQGGNTPRI